ncbi:tail fiber protein, partial [Flammeovirga sp. SJP92]
MKKIHFILLIIFSTSLNAQTIDTNNGDIRGFNRIQTNSGDWMDIQLFGSGSSFRIKDMSGTPHTSFVEFNSGSKRSDFYSDIFLLPAGNTRGNKSINLYRGSEGKDLATIGFGELGSQLNWHIGHLYYGGSPNKSFYISRSSSIINPDGTANHTPEFTILGNGQVGIGITTPSATLHVNNGDNSYGTILANADESNFSLYAKTITTQPINTESFRLGLKYASDEKNGFISFYRGSGTYGGFLGLSTNGIERVSIDSKGYVGIGRKSPSANLHVQHNGADRASVRVEGKGENNSGARDDISIHGDFVSGTADAASFDRYNVGISSWYGIGFHSSFNNRAGIVFDTRTANAYFDGKVG